MKLVKKNGFIFVETIVAIVVLSSSLLLLYSTFFNILQSEKTRIYYDDINYIYRAYYIKKELYNSNFQSLLKTFANNGSVIELVNVQQLRNSEFFNEFLSDFEVRQMYIIKNGESIRNLKNCTELCAYTASCTNGATSTACKNLYDNANSDLLNYIKFLNVDVATDYVLVIEFNSCDKNNNCRSYFSWVSVEI